MRRTLRRSMRAREASKPQCGGCAGQRGWHNLQRDRKEVGQRIQSIFDRRPAAPEQEDVSKPDRRFGARPFGLLRTLGRRHDSLMIRRYSSCGPIQNQAIPTGESRPRTRCEAPIRADQYFPTRFNRSDGCRGSLLSSAKFSRASFWRLGGSLSSARQKRLVAR